MVAESVWSTLQSHLQVVCVLPHVDAEDGDLALADDGVLVLGCDNDKPRLIARLDLDQPAPAAALEAEQCCVEGCLELGLVAPDGFDLLGELRRGRGLCFRGAGGREVLPKEGVVDVASGAELDALLEGDLRGDVGGVDGFDLGFECSVQVGDVRLVVLAVVQLHDLGRDVGFQCLLV